MSYTWIMSDKRVFDQLNHLVVVNNDAEAGFLTAAKNVRNSEIQTLFEGYASRHAALSAEIQDQVARLGERPIGFRVPGRQPHPGMDGLESHLDRSLRWKHALRLRER